MCTWQAEAITAAGAGDSVMGWIVETAEHVGCGSAVGERVGSVVGLVSAGESVCDPKSIDLPAGVTEGYAESNVAAN